MVELNKLDHWNSAAATTAQFLTIVGSVALVLALMINSFVFSAWGLSFLQLAGPTDAAMSGLNILLKLLPITSVGWLSFLIGYNSGPERRRFILKKIYILLNAIAIALAILPPLLRILPFFDKFSALYFLFAPSLLVAGYVWGAQARSYSHARWPVVTVSAFAILGVATVEAISRADSLSNSGYMPGLEMILEECSNEPADVLWMGTRSIVLRCKNRRMVIISGPENLVMKSNFSI